MLRRYTVLLVFLCVLNCGDAFLLRFPGKLTHRGSSAAMRSFLSDVDAEEAETIIPEAKVGNRRFVRRLPHKVEPVELPKVEILVKKVVKKAPKESEDENEEIVNNYDNPAWEEVRPTPERYNKTFVCVADITSSDMREKRSELFTTHMQWARRSYMSQDLEEHENDENNTSSRMFYRPEKAFVQHDYTLLTEDCTAPTTQVVIIRSDDVQHVHDYIAQEPMAAHHALSPWKVFEFVLESNSSTIQSIDEDHEEHKLSEIFHNPFESGFMLLSLCNSVYHNTKSKSNSTANITSAGSSTSSSTSDTITDVDSGGYNMTKLDEMTDLVDASYKYHANAARLEYVNPKDRPVESEHYQPLYENFSRIVTFGRLYHTDPPVVRVSGGKKSVSEYSGVNGVSGDSGVSGNGASSNSDSSDVDTSATTCTTTNVATSSTSTYRRGRVPNPFVEKMHQPEHLAGVLLLFNAVSRADALRYLKRDPVGGMGVEPHYRKGLAMSATTSVTSTGNSSSMFDRMTLSRVNIQDVHGQGHYLGANMHEQIMFDAIHFADPEDLLLQNSTYARLYTDHSGVVSTRGAELLPALPKTPMHYVNNANLLRQLVAYNVSYRYHRMPESEALLWIYSTDHYKEDSTRDEMRNRRRKGSSRGSGVSRGSVRGADAGSRGGGISMSVEDGVGVSDNGLSGDGDSMSNDGSGMDSGGAVTEDTGVDSEAYDGAGFV